MPRLPSLGARQQAHSHLNGDLEWRGSHSHVLESCGVVTDRTLMCGCSRELAELAAPGGLTAASVVLFLSLAWSGVEAPQALANINIPYQVRAAWEAS